MLPAGKLDEVDIILLYLYYCISNARSYKHQIPALNLIRKYNEFGTVRPSLYEGQIYEELYDICENSLELVLPYFSIKEFFRYIQKCSTVPLVCGCTIQYENFPTAGNQICRKRQKPHCAKHRFRIQHK